MTEATADQCRNELLTLAQRGDRYGLISRAEDYLAAVPGDDQVRLFTIRSYLELSMVEPARSLLSSASKVDRSTIDWGTIESRLSSLDSSPLDWSSRRSRFDDNLEALRSRGVDTQAIVQAWADGQHRYQLWVDKSGLEHVRYRSENGRCVWVPCFGNVAASDQARALPDNIKALEPGPYLLDGVGLGGYFERLYEATLDTFLGFSCALYVLESDPAAFALVLHLREWSSQLSDPRVHLFLGRDCTNEFTAVLRENVNLPLPSHAFSQPLHSERPGVSEVATIEALIQERTTETLASYRQVEQLYAGKDINYWAGRFADALSGKGEPLRILAGVSQHTTFLKYSMRDTQRAIESLGHKCMVLTEETPYELIAPQAYHRAILDFKPDVFFMFDHLRHEARSVVPENLPILTWDQDKLPHVMTAENMRKVPAQDFVVGCSKLEWIRAGCRSSQYLAIHIPTCAQQFGGPPPTADEHRRYECDLSYVSHASDTPEEFHRAERAKLTDEAGRQIIDRLYDLVQSELPRYSVMEFDLPKLLISRAVPTGAAVSESFREWLTGWYLWRLADRMFRHEALEWAGELARTQGLSLRIYGNGWERHPTLHPFAAGSATNGRELLCVHRCSRINLQLMPAGFIHQRALDGLAAGGFFLARATPHDLSGRALRSLAVRIRELGIETDEQLISTRDDKLQASLRQYARDWPGQMADGTRLLELIRVRAELLQTQEAFEDFDSIAFRTRHDFAEVTQRALNNDQWRHDVAARMRRSVLEHFGHRVTVQGMLGAMASNLKERAGRGSQREATSLLR